MRVLVRQHLEGERLQGVAGEDGRRLVELLVAGRLAAPQVVVVHGRQVVVDQRIGVHEFDRARGAQRRTTTATLNKVALGQHEKSAQPLAAAEAGIAHGLEDPRLSGIPLRQQTIHGALDRAGGMRQGGVEFERCDDKGMGRNQFS